MADQRYQEENQKQEEENPRNLHRQPRQKPEAKQGRKERHQQKNQRVVKHRKILILQTVYSIAAVGYCAPLAGTQGKRRTNSPSAKFPGSIHALCTHPARPFGPSAHPSRQLVRRPPNMAASAALPRPSCARSPPGANSVQGIWAIFRKLCQHGHSHAQIPPAHCPIFLALLSFLVWTVPSRLSQSADLSRR